MSPVGVPINFELFCLSTSIESTKTREHTLEWAFAVADQPQISNMESTDLPEEEKVPPSKSPPTLVTRCLNLTSSVKAKFMLVLPGAEGVEMMYNYISRFSFVTLHWVAFILWSLISSTLIWAIQGRQRTIGYLTCLFFAVSSVTDTGLAPANVSALNTFQQITLCINFILGSAPITGIVVLTVRKTSMESRYIEVIENLRIEEQAAQASFQLSRNFVGGSLNCFVNCIWGHLGFYGIFADIRPQNYPAQGRKLSRNVNLQSVVAMTPFRICYPPLRCEKQPLLLISYTTGMASSARQLLAETLLSMAFLDRKESLLFV